MNMRTNIVLDQTLVDEAFKYTQVTTKKELVHLALKTFIQTNNRLNLKEISGKISFKPGYLPGSA